MGYMYSLDQIPDLFSIPCQVVHTTGIGHGIILKFHSFYLKIYDTKGMSYKIQGYRYGDPSMIFEDIVEEKDMRSYARTFDHDDCLCTKCPYNTL